MAIANLCLLEPPAWTVPDTFRKCWADCIITENGRRAHFYERSLRSDVKDRGLVAFAPDEYPALSTVGCGNGIGVNGLVGRLTRMASSNEFCSLN